MRKRTPKAYAGLVFNQESGRSLETVWCLRTHTLTLLHFTAISQLRWRLLLLWRPLPKVTPELPLPEGSWGWGASVRGSVYSDCLLTSSKRKLKIPRGRGCRSW